MIDARAHTVAQVAEKLAHDFGKNKAAFDEEYAADHEIRKQIDDWAGQNADKVDDDGAREAAFLEIVSAHEGDILTMNPHFGKHLTGDVFDVDSTDETHKELVEAAAKTRGINASVEEHTHHNGNKIWCITAV